MQAKEFYSPARALCICMSPGQIVIGEDGRARRVNERHIQFTDTGGQYGRYVTTDPDEINYLNERAKQEPKDIYTFEEYTMALVPVEQRLATASRQVDEQNKLLAHLREKERELLEREKALDEKSGGRTRGK